MSQIVDPVDNWHTPSPSILLTLSSVVSEGLGPFSSVSGVLGWACEQVFGKDPFAWVVDQFDGDWQALSTAGDCLNQMGDWMQTVTDNAVTHAWSFSQGWTGNAALAARGQFLDMSDKIEPAADLVRECGRATDWLANKVFALATVVSAAVESVIAFLAAAVAPPALALAIPKALDTVLKIIGWITKGLASIDTVINGLMGQADSLSALPKIELTTGYDNPMVS